MWRTAFFIAGKDLRYLLRDRQQLVWLFLMPPIFMYFIGTTTAGFSRPNGPGRTSLAVRAPADAGLLVAQLEKRLAENGFDLVHADSTFARQAQRLEIPPAFDDSMLSGGGAVLRLTHKRADLARDLDLFRVRRAMYTTLADIAAAEVAGEVSSAQLALIDSLPRTLALDVEQAGQRRHIPSGFEQAIPGIMVMFVMMNMLTSGATLLVSERQRGLLRRLAYAPISRGAIVLGKWGGKMALGAVQIGVGLLFGTLLFGMDWGPHWWVVVAVLMAWGAFCASCGLLLGSLGRSEGQVAGLGMLATMLLAALGGCWWPIEIAPEWMQLLQQGLPSGWAMDAMHRLISFGKGAESVWVHVLALMTGAFLVGGLGARYFRFQ